MSVKNKHNLRTQCPHKKKLGDFCGIHQGKQNIRIDNLLTISATTTVTATATTTATTTATIMPANASASDITTTTTNININSQIIPKIIKVIKVKNIPKIIPKIIKLTSKLDKVEGDKIIIETVKIYDFNNQMLTLYNTNDLETLKGYLEKSVEWDISIDWNKVFYTCIYYEIDIKEEPNNFLKDLINYLETELIILSNLGYTGPGMSKYQNIAILDSIDTSLSRCKNRTDFHEMIPIQNIPKIFLFIFDENLNNTSTVSETSTHVGNVVNITNAIDVINTKNISNATNVIKDKDSVNSLYACDIRSLHEFITKSEQRKNPYTNLPLSTKILSLYEKRVNILKRNHVSLRLEEDELSNEKKYDLRILNIFQIMYNFGYPVEYQWFLKLTHNNRKRFYYCLEHMWNYRLTLTINQKLDVIPFKVFSKKEKDFIYKMEPNELNEFLAKRMEDLITMGKTKEDRISGAMYLLMGLIQVSTEAANALPQLRYAIDPLS